MINPILYENAEKLVAECSIPPHLTGFTFLTEAIVIKTENYTTKLADIYKKIATDHNSTHRAITRNITYAISQSNRICDYLSINMQDLFNGRVIAALALKLKSICNTELNYRSH